MFITTDQVGEELVRAFDGFKVNGKTIEQSGYFREYLKIGSTLSDPKGVLAAVGHLDYSMVKVLIDRMKASGRKDVELPQKVFREREQTLQKHFQQGKAKVNKENYPGKDPIYKGLLDAALWKEEEKAGFKRANDYMWSGLSAEMFLNNLRTKRPFKDYGAAIQHGEYTHRIQWYILSRTVFDSKDTAAEVYASIADWYYDQGKNDKNPSLWDALFDRADNTSFRNNAEDDFRSPLKLNTFLRKDSLATPILTAYLHKRFVKRSAQEAEAGALTGPALVSLKHFKVYSSMLSSEDSQTLLDLITNHSIEKQVA